MIIDTPVKSGEILTLSKANEIINGLDTAIRRPLGTAFAAGSFATGNTFNYAQISTASISITPNRQRAYLRLLGHIEASTTAASIPQQMVFSIGKSAVDIYDYMSFEFQVASQTYNFPIDMRVLVSTEPHVFTFWAWTATNNTVISKLKLALYQL